MNQTTTLEVVSTAFGWQGGTIHQAKNRFAVASLQEMDKVCNAIMRNLDSISDTETAMYFTRKRMEAIRMNQVALSNFQGA